MMIDFTQDELLEIEEALENADSDDPDLQANIDSAHLKVALVLQRPWAIRKHQEADSNTAPVERHVVEDAPTARTQLQSIASGLVDGWGDCPYGRTELLRWVEQEISRLKSAGVPAGPAATQALGLAYLNWIGDSTDE